MRISDWSSDVCSSDLALFLGRLAVGYSVRAFILYNLILPSLFGAVWMTAIAGATIALDQQSGAGLYAILTAQGPDPVLFRLFSALGGGPVVADRKRTRLNPVTNAHLVCRLLLDKKTHKQKN